MGRARLPGGRAQLLLDAALVVWTLWWLSVGVLVAHEVRGLAELSDTGGQLGRAAISIGETMDALPAIGAQVEEPANAIRDAGEQAVVAARSARASTRRVGVLLGVSIAAIPSLPVLLLYLPARIATARERRTLKLAVAAGDRREVDEVLAWRAVTHLPYRTLKQVSEDPARDLEDGLHGPLADAELEWFGVARPRRRPAARR
jgi:hypothetical protein